MVFYLLKSTPCFISKKNTREKRSLTFEIICVRLDFREIFNGKWLFYLIYFSLTKKFDKSCIG